MLLPGKDCCVLRLAFIPFGVVLLQLWKYIGLHIMTAVGFLLTSIIGAVMLSQGYALHTANLDSNDPSTHSRPSKVFSTWLLVLPILVCDGMVSLFMVVVALCTASRCGADRFPCNNVKLLGVLVYAHYSETTRGLSDDEDDDMEAVGKGEPGDAGSEPDHPAGPCGCCCVSSRQRARKTVAGVDATPLLRAEAATEVEDDGFSLYDLHVMNEMDSALAQQFGQHRQLFFTNPQQFAAVRACALTCAVALMFTAVARGGHREFRCSCSCIGDCRFLTRSPSVCWVVLTPTARGAVCVHRTARRC